MARLLLDRMQSGARPAADRRERGRRLGHDRHRPRRARGARRLHAQHGQLDEPRRRARDVSDRPIDIQHDLEPVSMLLVAPTVIVGRQGLPPNTLQELVAWLKANPDKATAATVGRRQSGARQRHPFPERHRHAHSSSCPIAAAARRTRIWSAGRSTCGSAPRPRRCCRMCAAGGSRPTRFCPRSAGPRRRTFRRPMRRACRASRSRCGPGSGRPRARPRTSSQGSTQRSVEALADPAVRQRITDAGYDIPAPDQLTPEALAAHHKAETEKWWPSHQRCQYQGGMTGRAS